MCARPPACSTTALHLARTADLAFGVPIPQGFVARPKSLPDGTQDMLHWDCAVPGKAGTIWEAGHYPVYMCAHCQGPDKLRKPHVCTSPGVRTGPLNRS
jgi:hypothetical protein